jgi:hypothetical protein
MNKPPDDDFEESFKTVKRTLNSICKNVQIKERINEFVLNANKIMFEAYALSNLHVSRLLKENKPIPSLDQQFFQDICCFVSDMYEKNAQRPDNIEMEISFKLYSACRPDNYMPGFRDYSAIIINYVKKEMVVSTHNHLVLNFYNRFSKYLKSKYKYTNIQSYNLIKNIYNMNDTDVFNPKKINSLFWFDKLNNKIPSFKTVKENPTYILRIYNEILNYNIEYNYIKKNKAIRLFSLLPFKNSFTMSNITIDKSVLRDIVMSFRRDEFKLCIQKYSKQGELLNEYDSYSKASNSIGKQSGYVKSRLIKTEPKDNFIWKLKENNESYGIDYTSKKTPEKYWKLLFKIENMDTFAGIIKTDGNSVSIMYKNKRQIISKKKLNIKGIQKEDFSCNVKDINIDDFNVVKAYDPGFRYMFTGGNNNNLEMYSSKKYYHKCKMNKAKNDKNIIYKKSNFITDFFKNMPSNKTNNIINYLSYALKSLTKCLKFHFEKPFRKLKFTTYIFKQKTMNEICKSITEKKHINDQTKKSLIGFGDWSSQKDSIIRGHHRGPVVGIKRELKKWCKLVLVDEFRTSVRCYKCYNETEKIAYNNVKVNSVLRCTNNECGTVIDRDINAYKNIFYLFELSLRGRDRPKEFCRDEKKILSVNEKQNDRVSRNYSLKDPLNP